MTTLFIHGEPEPQPRPRSTTVNGNARIYSPRTKWRKWVESGLRALMDQPRGVDEERPAFYSQGQPVFARLEFLLPRAQSHVKKRGGLRKGAPRHPLGPRTGDLDNLAKLILDAANGLLWDDDAQVTRLEVRKCYVEPGKGGVRITYRLDTEAIQAARETA